MPYQVPANDPLSPQRRRLRRININPFFLHLALVIIILVVFFFYFTPDSKTNLKDDQEILLVGELEVFNFSYEGDLNLKSTEFLLNTRNARFDEGANTFIISNFSGEIYEFNKSIMIEGKAKTIEFGKNSLNLNYDDFKLISKKKTTLDIFFSNVSLTFVEGRVKVADVLNYELDDSNLFLTDFNSSITYDSAYSISGKVNTFEIGTEKQGIHISYKNE